MWFLYIWLTVHPTSSTFLIAHHYFNKSFDGMFQSFLQDNIITTLTIRHQMQWRRQVGLLFFYLAQLGHPRLEPALQWNESSHLRSNQFGRINRFLLGSISSFLNAAYKLYVVLRSPSGFVLPSSLPQVFMERKKKY